MAPKASAPAVKENPLSYMQRLSAAVSYYEPQSLPMNGDPHLILMLTWMAARELHIAKYVEQQRLLFPSSRILVARCPIDHFLYPPSLKPQLAPVIPFLQKYMVGEDFGKEKILVHVFSNGGINTMVRLKEMLEAETTVSFPRHVMILDSCPGYFNWSRTHLALAQSLPWWTSPLIHLFLGIQWLTFAPLGYDPLPDANAKAVNDTALLELEPRRTYLFGTGDEMVHWRDVEHHADEAAKKSSTLVRRESFEGGRHCAHVRVDFDRYWKTVKETWVGS